MGHKVIINKQHWGLVYDNELFSKVSLGEKRKAFIHKIREDNKIDVRLQADGYGVVEPMAQKILEAIKANNGFLALTDKSDPEVIYANLEMSKKVFKKAIGSLYKKKIILLEKDGIRLVK